jgi:hypothetical protein
MKLDPRCENCHPGGWSPDRFDHSVSGVRLDELHKEAECGDCHMEGAGLPASCELCHDEGKAYEGGIVGFETEE